MYFQIACKYQISFMTDQLSIIVEHFYYTPHKIVGEHLDLHFSGGTYVHPYIRPEILCVQLLPHPLMDFVHAHTQ